MAGCRWCRGGVEASRFPVPMVVDAGGCGCQQQLRWLEVGGCREGGGVTVTGSHGRGCRWLSLVAAAVVVGCRRLSGAMEVSRFPVPLVMVVGGRRYRRWLWWLVVCGVRVRRRRHGFRSPCPWLSVTAVIVGGCGGWLLVVSRCGGGVTVSGPHGRGCWWLPLLTVVVVVVCLWLWGQWMCHGFRSPWSWLPVAVIVAGGCGGRLSVVYSKAVGRQWV